MLGGVLLLSVACGTPGDDAASGDAGEPLAYAIDVELWFGAQAREEGFVLAWADGYAGPAIQRASSAAIRRAFATREDALAFTGAFELTLGNQEPTRVDLRFSDCDLVTDAGLDPTEMRQLVKRYQVFESIEEASNLSWTPPTSCYRQVQQIFPGTPVDVRRMSFMLPNKGPIDLLRDGQSIPVGGVGSWSDIYLYEIFLDWPLEVDPSDAVAALGVWIDGVDAGEVEASFKGCAPAPGDGGQFDPINLRLQQVTLGVAEGALFIDAYAGCFCDYVLGSSSWFDACGDL